MVTNIGVSRDCVRKLIIIGWVLHGIGLAFMVTSLATNHWLRRETDGDHAGIIPCCPTLTCGQSVVSSNGANIDIIIVGILLVGLGWVLSLTYFCVTRRHDKRTLVVLSYLSSGLVTVGGIILVAAAIEFAVTIPGEMETSLEQNCKGQASKVNIDFSYDLFVTAALAFILAGVLLFLGSCKHNNNPVFTSTNGTRPSNTTMRWSNNVALMTVTAHLAARRSSPRHSSTTNFDNSLHNNCGTANLTAGQQRRARINQQMLKGCQYPHYNHDILQPPTYLPSYESINEGFLHQDEHLEAGEREDNVSQVHCPNASQVHCPNASQVHCPNPIASASIVEQPQNNDVILKEQSPPYTDSQ